MTLGTLPGPRSPIHRRHDGSDISAQRSPAPAARPGYRTLIPPWPPHGRPLRLSVAAPPGRPIVSITVSRRDRFGKIPIRRSEDAA
jgi:hypothetical protein